MAATLIIRPFEPADEAAVVALWQRCELTRGWNDPHKDIARKLTVQPELFVVGVVQPSVLTRNPTEPVLVSGDLETTAASAQAQLLATAMFGFEGHRGWVNYLAVDPEHQRGGYARALMAWGEAALMARGCPKINLQVRTTNAGVLAMYERLGYARDDVVSLGKRLIADS
jgi:ribosomal protein S18 acetylase RimI-like enzyme